MPKNKKSAAALEAEHGEKMIEIKLRFWTNDIAKEPGKVLSCTPPPEFHSVKF